MVQKILPTKMDNRMFLKKISFLFLSLIIYSNTILPSIAAGTFIKTPHGFVTAENIAIGDTIIAYDHQTLSTATITHISTAITDTLIAITTNKGSFYTCPDQLFFDPVLQQWITARDITTQNTFLDAKLNFCPCLHVSSINIPEATIHRISTTAPHNFFTTEQELLTHNAFPVIVGIAWLFGEGLQFAGITLGTTAFGSYVGVQIYNAQKQKQNDKEIDLSFEVSSNGYTPDPNDDDENERKFNTISKTEFFKSMKKHYKYYKEDIYRTKSDAFGKKTKYIKWDHLHDDIEAYTKSGEHLGSINPKTLRFYKPANPRNKINV
jgi:hypothetical protein